MIKIVGENNLQKKFTFLSNYLTNKISGDDNTTSAACSTEDKGLSSYLYMLLFGQALHGFAGTVLYSIAPSYLDGSVSSAQSPTYLGKIFSVL